MAEGHKTFRLRYVGARFAGARLPLDVLSDLPAFRDLLAAYAKEHWRALNQQRRRLPKGFDRSISFDLIALEEGSAVPKLDWSRRDLQEVLPGFAGEMEELVSSSYDELVAVIDGVSVNRFPKALSPEQIGALNKFGTGLRDSEKIEFVGSRGTDGNVVYLNTARRKALITRVRETYDARYESTGRLTGLHEGGRLTVLTEKYGELLIGIDPARIPDFDGNLGADIQFSLKIMLDSQDAFRGVVDVYEVDLIDAALAENLEKARARLGELRSLPAGWHDGEGMAIAPKAAEAAAMLLYKRPELAGAYRIFPTLGGGLTFEFEKNGWDLSVEFDVDGRPEIYGVKLDGPDELEPQGCEELGDKFLAAFDRQTGR
jgi:hypothetical protein